MLTSKQSILSEHRQTGPLNFLFGVRHPHSLLDQMEARGVDGISVSWKRTAVTLSLERERARGIKRASLILSPEKGTISTQKCWVGQSSRPIWKFGCLSLPLTVCPYPSHYASLVLTLPTNGYSSILSLHPHSLGKITWAFKSIKDFENQVMFSWRKGLFTLLTAGIWQALALGHAFALLVQAWSWRITPVSSCQHPRRAGCRWARPALGSPYT